jgi:3',5'-cyclic AMP phosphodiesterase CpdA
MSTTVADSEAPGWPAGVPTTPDGRPPERPTHVLVHLSDTHLTPAGVAYNGSIDTDATLARAVRMLRSAIAGTDGVDAIVASGDLTDTGDPDAYRRVRAGLESLGLPVIWATGNHDVRTAFHEHVLELPDVAEPILQVHDVSGLRVMVLDSTVPGAGDGMLQQGHLDELADALVSPAEHGSIVVLHHAPIPPPSPLLTYFALHRESRAALARVIAGTDVRLVLAGHHHLAQSGMLGGIPVAVAGSVAIRTDPLAQPGRERTTTSASLNLVSVYPDTVTVSVVPIDDAATVFDLAPAESAAIIGRAVR